MGWEGRFCLAVRFTEKASRTHLSVTQATAFSYMTSDKSGLGPQKKVIVCDYEERRRKRERKERRGRKEGEMKE